jgi:hypothetical protein
MVATCEHLGAGESAQNGGNGNERRRMSTRCGHLSRRRSPVRIRLGVFSICREKDAGDVIVTRTVRTISEHRRHGAPLRSRPRR